MKRDPSTDWPFIFLSGTLLCLFTTVFHTLVPDSFVNPGPLARIAEASRSLWNNGTLQAPEFYALRDKIIKLSLETDQLYWQDAFSVGKSEELFPKHSLWTVVTFAAFYGVFGEAGFMLGHQLLAFLLVLLFYRLTNLTGTQCNSIVFAVVLLFFFKFMQYSFFFNYELHAAILIVGGVCLARSNPFLGNLLMCLSLFVRPSFGLILPLLAVTWCGERDKKYMFGSLAGLSAGLMIFALSNHFLWGSPFLTSYHQAPQIYQGELLLNTHPVGLNYSIFFSDWGQKIFNSEFGLLTNYPILLLLPIALYKHIYLRTIHPATILASSGFLLILFLFSYEHLYSQGGRLQWVPVLLCLPIVLQAFLPQSDRKPQL